MRVLQSSCASLFIYRRCSGNRSWLPRLRYHAPKASSFRVLMPGTCLQRPETGSQNREGADVTASRSGRRFWLPPPIFSCREAASVGGPRDETIAGPAPKKLVQKNSLHVGPRAVALPARVLDFSTPTSAPAAGVPMPSGAAGAGPLPRKRALLSDPLPGF